MIDSKFEHITRNVDQQTANLKSTFDDLTSSLSKINKELTTSFKDKVVKIKSMCSTFFAKMESQVDGATKKVEKIELSHDKFTQNFVNPAKEVEAKIFSMQQ